MRHIYLAFFVCIFSVSSVFAQSTNVQGTIVDELSSLPMEFASVTLYRIKDSSVADGVVTQKDGRFSLSGAAGNYFIKVNFIGYQPLSITTVQLAGNKPLDLGIIRMKPQQGLMEEIKISSQKTVYNRLDKQVYKADQFGAAKGGTAIDMIRNVPSVTVNGEGHISMRGAGFQVLINGKPVLTDAQTVLSQLPANAIENIELVTSPSAKYDPDGKGGIINIITKKATTDGSAFTANIQGGLPSVHDYKNLKNPQRFGGDLTFNFRKNKWDITASANYLRNDIAGSRDGDVNTTINNVFTSFPSFGERSFHRYSYAGRASVVYTPNKNNAVSAGIYKGIRFQSRRADLLYRNSQVNRNTGETLRTFHYFNSNLQTKEGGFLLGNVDYNHTFPNKGTLTVSTLYEVADLYGNTKNLNQHTPYGKDTIQYTYNTNTNPLQGYRTNVDYALPVGNGKWETGYQYRYDKQMGDFLYLTLDQVNNRYVTDPLFSSGVHSKNTIHSAYSQYSGRQGKFTFSGGLRYEYARRELVFSKDPKAHLLNLSNFFPSANVQYQASHGWKWKAGYSRRVQRAKNYELNPYPEREHSETLEQGDAGLLPEFIDLLEAGIIKDFNKGSVFATLYHQQIKNPIQRVNKVYNDTILNRVFTNAGRAKLWGLELGTSIKPVQWWQLYVGGNIYNYQINGNIFNNTIAVANNNWVYSVNANTSFQLSPTWSCQFNLNYLSRRPTAQGEDSYFLTPNSSLKKALMKGKMSVLLQWQNMDMGLLRTNEQRITTRGKNFFTTTNYIYEVDMFLLNVSFNLNQLTKKLKLPVSEFGEKEF